MEEWLSCTLRVVPQCSVSDVLTMTCEFERGKTNDTENDVENKCLDLSINVHKRSVLFALTIKPLNGCFPDRQA